MNQTAFTESLLLRNTPLLANSVLHLFRFRSPRISPITTLPKGHPDQPATRHISYQYNDNVLKDLQVIIVHIQVFKIIVGHRFPYFIHHWQLTLLQRL
jgi:hypothetical protein